MNFLRKIKHLFKKDIVLLRLVPGYFYVLKYKKTMVDPKQLQYFIDHCSKHNIHIATIPVMEERDVVFTEKA